MSSSPRSKATLIVVVVLCLLVSGIALGQHRRGKRASDIRIVHQKHIDRNMACLDCHANIREHTGANRIYPPKSICDSCHDVKDREQCGLCHVEIARVEDSVGYGDEIRPIVFSHADHPQTMDDCEDCHGYGGRLDPSVLDHEDCNACHSEAIENLQCALCHRTFQSIGLSKLSNFSHKDNFLTDHPGFARLTTRTCSQCHHLDFCTDCHNKREGVLRSSVKFPELVRRSFIHRGDWITTHAAETGFQQERCLKCHTINTCQSCHARNGKGPQSEVKLMTHPKGWINPNSSKFHGPEARRRIIECASCHDRGPGSNCIRCHSLPQNNPHPSGWTTAPGIERGKDRPCSFCHKD
ncbi:MAG: hypothetical protein P9M14_09420 [Candidatus Alcyoniella australis]|nr:hypothetical protein [Candidatus Alcyoniella australis]